jgi:hypothetical protein
MVIWIGGVTEDKVSWSYLDWIRINKSYPLYCQLEAHGPEICRIDYLRAYMNSQSTNGLSGPETGSNRHLTSI